MYLHFEDWSPFLPLLGRQGKKHGGKIIKVFATDDDPRERLNKSSLVVVESSDEPFTEEDVFDFGERGVYTGRDFEQAVAEKGANDKATRIARALMRFATREDTGFAYVGMQIRVGDRFLIEHPLDGLHGWERAVGGRAGLEETLHLDIFSPISLPRLRRIVDFEDPAQILSYQEVTAYNREQMQSGRKEQL